MQIKSWIYPSRPYLRSDLLLGSLIHDIHSPATEALTVLAPVSGQDCSRHDDAQITTSALAHLSPAQKRTLASVFLGAVQTSESPMGALTIQAHHGFVYQLWSPKAWFDKLCSNPPVRDWLESGYASKKEAWMVVGCKTIVNADFVAEERKLSEKDSKEEEEEWEFPGERIYALALRKIEMRFFERKEGECFIWGPIWESHSKVLGGEGEMEIVEASLEPVEGEEGGLGGPGEE